MSWAKAARLAASHTRDFFIEAMREMQRKKGATPRCPNCGTPTIHHCSWVCVEMCPKCNHKRTSP